MGSLRRGDRFGKLTDFSGGAFSLCKSLKDLLHKGASPVTPIRLESFILTRISESLSGLPVPSIKLVVKLRSEG
jgi:hypothetical protein